MLRGSGAFAIVCVAGAALAGPAGAVAARPTAVTGAVENITQQTGTFTGTVDGNRRSTTYYFDYGPTADYGAQTTPTPTSDRRKAVRVVADVAGLQPYTRYHYRVVAYNADGRVRGRDRTFRTQAVPLGLTLSASPNPTLVGAPTTLVGTLAGTGNAGRRIRLQANAFPYLSGFNPVGNEVVTDAQGNFAVPILTLPVTTQFQVYVSAESQIASPIVTVGAAVRVTTRLKRIKRLRRAVSVRFAGRIAQARDGVLVELQRLRRDGQWRTVRRTIARHAAAAYSRYAQRVRVRRRGTYRVLVNSDGQYVSNVGRDVRVRVRVRRR
jgi:hypothetical protein